MGTRKMHGAHAMTGAAPTPAQATARAPSPDFDEAFTLHHRAVYGAAYGLLRDVGLAEDVTQEVFLRLYHNLETVPQGELLRPWLLRVAINLSYNTLRTRTRTGARDDEFAQQAVGLEGASESVEAEFERRREIEEARRALAKIDEPMRSCLLLKQQGLSYREIAAAVSVNESYVGSLIARGRKEFARVYGKVGGK
ncbi:MAG: sigma-70 family RNA polymerase sigma factor [Pyrinomonadaceae bacterium]